MKKEKKVQSEPKKKRNIIVFFVIMVIALYLFDQIMYQLYPIITRMILYGKFGREALIEGVCAILILIVLLLFKNSYVFTEKKEGFFKSLIIGGYIVLFSTLMLGLSSLKVTGNVDLLDLGSLAIFCLLIGIFEEFLCRGWIQNEFIERFASNRKQIILSIFLSAFIFGGIHISNIWIGGQSVIDTIAQIIQATGIGFLFGAIYYRTKNIWSVVFLHGYWDFALFVGELNIIKACTQGDASLEYKIAILATSTLLALMYITIGLFILRKHKTKGLIKGEELTPEEETKSKKQSKKYIFCAIVFFFISLEIPLPEIEETCYTYEDKEVYFQEITYPIYTEYTITKDNTNIKIFLDDNNKLNFQNITTEEKVSFNKEYVDSFIIVEDNGIYKIAIIAYNKYGTDTELYYTELTIENLNNLQDINKLFSYIDKAPTMEKLAYINSENTKYIIIETLDNEQLLFDDQDVYTIKRNTTPSEIIEEPPIEENTPPQEEVPSEIENIQEQGV